jgi:hypothetical protein
LKVERLRRKRKADPAPRKSAGIRDGSRVEAWIIEDRKSKEPGWITAFLKNCAGALR